MHRVTNIRVTCLAVLLLLLPGCIIIRTTDHRIRLNKDGSGEGTIRLVDIRTDARTDSVALGDFATLIAAFNKDSVTDFERDGRKITRKQLVVHGDTLIAEVTYTFPSLGAVEGIHSKGDEIFVVVGDDREVVRTNGKIDSWKEKNSRIVWEKDAKRLQYVIREKALPPTRSLAAFYVKYGQ
jgi:hypothetical protein